MISFPELDNVDLNGTFTFVEAMILTEKHGATMRRRSWPETWCIWFEPFEPERVYFPMLKDGRIVCLEPAPSELYASDWVINLPQ